MNLVKIKLEEERKKNEKKKLNFLMKMKNT